MPPNLRGDVRVAYGGDFQQVGIEEGESTFGIRNTLRHDLGIRAEFGAYHGIAVTVGLPVNIQQQIRYPTAREMLYEPVLDTGSFRNGAELTAPPAFDSGGVAGIWLGAAFAPISTRYKRSLPLDTRFELAVRTPGRKNTMYGPTRGGHPGGAALRIAAAFSARSRNVDPYITFNYTQEFDALVDSVVDNSGRTVATDITMRAPSVFDARAGAELILRDDPARWSLVTLDLYLGVGHRSWSDRASGFHLPDVLSTSQDISVTQSGHVVARGGAALRYEVNRWVGFRLGAEGRYITPHVIEHVYAARTDTQSYEVGWSLALVGRIRLKDD
jgi:hypothetical protein